MDFSLRPDDRPPKPRQFLIPPHLPRRTSVADSVDSEDPLPQSSSGNQPPNLLRPPTASGGVSGQGRSRIAVVLNNSPHKSAHTAIDPREGEGNYVVSDLSRQYSKQKSKPAANASPKQHQQPGTPPVPRPRGRPKGVGNAPKTIKPTAAGSRQARQQQQQQQQAQQQRVINPAAGPGPSQVPKRRGRPPKQPSPPPREIYQRSEAPFVAFLCEWRGCKAELHNLSTLRRHVTMVHGREGDEPHCRWGKCGQEGTDMVFVSEELLNAHIEAAHLVPFAWHVGDGPENHLEAHRGRREEEDGEIPDYLKDREGKQVTPSVRDQQMEDIATWKENRRKLRDLLRRRNENLPDEEESEEVDEEMY